MSIHQHVRSVLQQTNEAYITTAGGINADYAEYASMAISEFRRALVNPDLCERSLRHMIRKAGPNCSSDCVEALEEWSEYMARRLECWSDFMVLQPPQSANDR